jgi:hypothetical protein
MRIGAQQVFLEIGQAVMVRIFLRETETELEEVRSLMTATPLVAA